MTRVMKSSGVEWIGQIPNLWSTIRIKNIIAQRDAGAWGEVEQGNDNDVICIRVADFDYSHFTIQNNKDYTLRNYSDLQIKSLKLNKGDILIEKSGGGEKTPVGRTVIFDKNFKALFANFIERIRVTEEIYYKYFQYIFSSFYSQGHTKLYIKQTTGIQNLNITEMFSREVIPLPPLPEQQAIADYLDDKCAQIDNITATINEQIEVLKQYKKSVITEAVTKGLDPNVPMKDSGVDWIGQIPETWEVIKGKYCLNILNRPVKADDGVITCFRDGEVTLRSKRREDGFTISLQETGYQGINPGDLVVHGMDGFAGAIGISDSRGKATPVLNVLDTTNNKKFFMYYLRTLAFNEVFIALSTGIRVRSCDTNWNKLRQLEYLIPSLPEQQVIANYLDDKCAQIDAVIADKQAQLETLAAYKKSLIYEYVTGKKSVPSFEEA